MLSERFWDMLARQQEAVENRLAQKKQELLQLHKAYGEAIEVGDLERANDLALELHQSIKEYEKLKHEDDRFCPRCGGFLRPYSLSWYEGYHIDGCE